MWSDGQGSISVPSSDQTVLFVSQSAYMVIGSLRRQLQYPFGDDCKASDEEMLEALEAVGLSSACGDQLDAKQKWEKVLSIGEQQRLSVARVLVHKPEFVFLDEATAANDPVNERRMYECIARTCTGWLSIGHRTSLEKYHSKRLRLLGPSSGGAWEMEDLEDGTQSRLAAAAKAAEDAEEEAAFASAFAAAQRQTPPTSPSLAALDAILATPPWSGSGSRRGDEVRTALPRRVDDALSIGDPLSPQQQQLLEEYIKQRKGRRSADFK